MKLKTLILSSLALCFSIITHAQERVHLNSKTTTTSYNFSDYSAIEVSGDFEISLNFSNSEESITLEANSNIMERVNIYKDGNTLMLKLKHNWNWNGKIILKVDISTKGMINNFKLSGDAVVRVHDPINTNSLELYLKGDSVLDAKVKANELILMAKGDSIVSLSGSVGELKALLASDSILKGKELSIENADLDLSGDSQAWINVSTSLSAVASGDSIVRYSGNPAVKRSSMTGDSEIHRMK